MINDRLHEVYKKSGLGKWFHSQSAGDDPGWDRYNSKGEQSIDEGVYITKQNFYMYLKKIFVGMNQTYKMKIFFKGEDVKEVEFFIKQILKQSKK